MTILPTCCWNIFPNYNVDFISWFCNIQSRIQKTHWTNYLLYSMDRAFHLSDWSSQGMSSSSVATCNSKCHLGNQGGWRTDFKAWWDKMKNTGSKLAFESFHLSAMPFWIGHLSNHPSIQSTTIQYLGSTYYVTDADLDAGDRDEPLQSRSTPSRGKERKQQFHIQVVALVLSSMCYRS